ncbi:hypothetical protein AB0368_16110 [Actinoplanes sp. NPDC051475]|uniref:hypothetical protein n=1 Tax=Actinoplanes sp. NPDC051475 TaxID=3157225 RepID=UPI0034505806
MSIPRISAAVMLALATAALTGCSVTLASPSAESASPPPSPSSSSSSSSKTKTAPKKEAKTKAEPSHEGTTVSRPSPRIVSFTVFQKPGCPSGTDVSHTDAVPLILKWKVTGAHSAALSVDDPTGTPGTYGPVALQGMQEFHFSCSGAAGSTETHTYALYTVGGGKQTHRTLKVSATVHETGIPVS